MFKEVYVIANETLSGTVLHIFLKYFISAREYVQTRKRMGFFSFSECKFKTYGVNCSMKCGHCQKKKQCHHITGFCKKGCKKGFQGDGCNKGT